MSVGQDPQEPSPNADSARQIHFGTGRLRRECWVTMLWCPTLGPVGTRRFRRRFSCKLGRSQFALDHCARSERLPQTDVRRMVITFAQSEQANSHECQPGTGSLWRSRSNSPALPSGIFRMSGRDMSFVNTRTLIGSTRRRSVSKGPRLGSVDSFTNFARLLPNARPQQRSPAQVPFPHPQSNASF
jgi:hypothetical protein